MSKPFNIHDWQAKQRKQLLNEASEVGPTIADQIFELFDHKIGEWTISPDYRVTQETQKYLEAWKEEAKSRINLILGDVNEASMTGTGASVPAILNTDDLERLKHFRDNLDDMMYDAGYSGDWILKIKTILRGIIDSNVNEASMTGTGASITTGDSMAYATPKAFKKKNKED